MQGYQYSKDSPQFESSLLSSQRDKLLLLLSTVSVFLCLCCCLLLMAQHSIVTCTHQGDTNSTLTCTDISSIYTCPPLPIRLSMVLQIEENQYIRYMETCKWTNSAVEIRFGVIVLAGIAVVKGGLGVMDGKKERIDTFLLISPVAISLLFCLSILDASTLFYLNDYETSLLNRLTGSQFEGFLSTLTFSFSTFYVFSPSIAYFSSAVLILIAKMQLNSHNLT